MLLLALGGVVLGFVFLLLSLLTDNAAWAYGCIAVCVVAGVVLVLDVLRRRRPASDGPADAPLAAEHPGDEHPGDEHPSDEHRSDEHGDDGSDLTTGTDADSSSDTGRSGTGTAADERGDDPTEVIGAARAAGGRSDAADAHPVGDAPTQQIPAVRDDEVSAATLLAEPAGRHGRAGADADVEPARAEDEPDVEDPTSQEGATAAASEAEVLVVDERPRFHVAGCSWLAGRETIPLPAREAVDLGFSPCAVCRPVAALARG